MKDYLVCFKKAECRVEIGVKVGGLPREVLRVSGTSVVHYELIRRGSACGCVCETMCVRVCIEKGGGKDGKKESRHVLCVYNVCICLNPCGGRCVRVRVYLYVCVVCRRGLACIS